MAKMLERLSADLTFYEKKYESLVKQGFMAKHPRLQDEMKQLIATLRTLKRMS